MGTSTHMNRYHHRGRELTQHNTLHNNNSVFNSQYDVKWGGLMLPMPWTRTYHMPLPLHQMSMNVMNMDISSWTVLTEYLLQEHQCHTTRHTEIMIPNWAEGTTRKIKKVDTDPDHTPRYSRHHSSSCCDLYRGHSRSQQKDRHSNHRCSSRQSHSAHQGHSHRSWHDTPHWSQHKSSTHCSSSGSYSQEHSRSHSWPTHWLSKYSTHWKGSSSLRSYSNQGNWRLHHRRSKKST